MNDFLDLDSIDANYLETQVCIVGGGLAGLAIADELAKQNVDVVVCERGDKDLTAQGVDSYTGKCNLYNFNDDVRSHDSYLLRSRLKMLGGAGNHWGGSCTFFDELDFEKRPWVPGGAWPINFKELVPFYKKACDLLMIKYPGLDGKSELNIPYKPFDLSFTEHVVNTYKQRTRFATQRHIYLKDKQKEVSSKAKLILNSQLIDCNLVGGEIVEAIFQSAQKKKLLIKAKNYILCCGGIENARLLLQLSSKLPHKNDNIGRYFMEHLVYEKKGTIHLIDREIDIELFKYPKEFEGYFELNQKIRKEKDILGLKVGLMESRIPPVNFYPISKTSASRVDLRILIGEQVPNRNSRITLSKKKDNYGMPRVELNWRLLKKDYTDILKSIHIMAQEFGKADVGRFKFNFNAADMIMTNANYHHMGTTRMSSDPSNGVVDADCRLHGMQNFFVAGSSVFPTSGSAHPTVNLLALAFRLAEQIKETINK